MYRLPEMLRYTRQIRTNNRGDKMSKYNHKKNPIGVTEDNKPILSWDSIFRIQDRMERQAKEQKEKDDE